MKQKFGVKKDDIVAMDMMNSDVFIWTWFGLWSIGAKPAFINYNLTGNPLVHSISASTARTVIVQDLLQSKYSPEILHALKAGSVANIIFLNPTILSEIASASPKREPDDVRSGQLRHSMAILIYTSGTTGLPKPAIVSWTKAVVAPLWVAKWLPLTTSSIFYTCMPLYHSSASLLCVCACIAAGCTLSLGSSFRTKGFWDDCRKTGATHIQYVGEACRYLLSAPESPLDRQHQVRTAFGNGMKRDVWAKFKERFGIAQVNEFYGATEGPSALFNHSRNSFAEGAVGMSGALFSRLMGKRSVVLKMDEEMETPVRDPKTGFCVRVRSGEPGELAIKLDEKKIEAGFQGYFGNIAATNKKILRHVFKKGDAYFSSGDVLRKDSEGRWFFCDRIGDTYRWKSENVSTAEVAEVLGKIDKISETNVYGVQIPGHDGRAGCAALVLRDDLPQITETLLRELASQAFKSLPRYAVPIFLRVLSDDTAKANRTGTHKQQKHKFRSEGVDPDIVGQKGDILFWLPPGSTEYKKYGPEDWKALESGKVKL